MKMNKTPNFHLLLFLPLVIWLTTSCQEDFIASPPFPHAQDTLRLDSRNFFYFNPKPQYSGEIPIYPFAYRLFNTQFEGFLLNGETRIYAFDSEATPDDRFLLLDREMVPGDTIHKFSDFLYHLLLDRRQDGTTSEEVYYLMRQRLIGMRSRRENMIWVISPNRGIIAAADFNIDATIGEVAFERIVGSPSYFSDQELIRLLKYYAYHTARVVDLDRNIIYKFDKLTGVVSSRDFGEARDLDEYQFSPGSTNDWVNFRLELEGGSLKLINEDSCLYFSPQLELNRSGICP